MAGRDTEAYGTILDYIRWRGDLDFERDPWNDIDSLILSQLCYANFGENERTFDTLPYLKIGDLATSDVLERYPLNIVPTSVKLHRKMHRELPYARRFQDIRILDQVNDVDTARNIQFSAMTLEVPSVGTVVAYRGTDPSVVGWKEDFMMSYATPVPAQTAAAAYLERAAARTAGRLYLTGHSKGGNLAVYAAAHADAKIRERIGKVYSFDGPGLDDETMASAGYESIRERICSVIPADSVVGLLMNYHPDYRVVESTASSLLQHEPLTWKILGREFLERETVSVQSQVMNQTMHEWLNTCSQEQREVFVTAVFSLFEKKRPGEGRADADPAEKAMDESSRRMVRELLHRLIAIQAENSYFARVKRPLAQAAEELRMRLAGDEENGFRSDMIRIDNHGAGFRRAADEAQKAAEFGGLGQKNMLRLQLLAEEMMSMAQAITGDMEGTFWVEKKRQWYELHLNTVTEMNQQKRKALILSTTERKNEASRSFLGRLRDAFEQAMLSGKEDVYYDMQSESSGQGGGMKPNWDRYEQSVLLRLADNVRIAIRGDEVSMTVTKDFSA